MSYQEDLEFHMEYTYTTNELKDYYQSFLTGANTGVMACFFVLVYFNVVFYIIKQMSSAPIPSMFWLNVIVSIVLAIIFISSNIPRIVHWYSKVTKKPQQSVLLSVIFKDDHLIVVGDSTAKIKYDQLKKVMFTKKYIFLVCENDNPIIIPNIEFKSGDFLGLKNFLASRVEDDAPDPSEVKAIRNAKIFGAVIMIVLPFVYYVVFVLM